MFGRIFSPVPATAMAPLQLISVTAEVPLDLSSSSSSTSSTSSSSPQLPPTPESGGTFTPQPPCTSPQPVASTSTAGQDTDASSDANAPKQKGKPTPAHLKDEAYYARRAKNNLSAKKSRDKHRQMELENAKKVIELTKLVQELEKENEALKTHVAVLMSMIDKVQKSNGVIGAQNSL